MDNLLRQITEKKQKLDKFKPLPPELVKNLEEWLKVELTYSSNAIEGNTLSRIETAEVIERSTAAVIKQLAKELKRHQSIKEKGTDSASRNLLKIGELAQIAGETIHTLRYWTKMGLLEIADVTPGGYQLYSPNASQKVKRIRKLQQEKRLTIEEIKKTLKIKD